MRKYLIVIIEKVIANAIALGASQLTGLNRNGRYQSGEIQEE